MPSALGAGVITTTAEITATGAATAGTTSIEAVAATVAAAIAAILPTTRSGTSLAGAAVPPTPGGSTAAAIATASSGAIATTAAAVATSSTGAGATAAITAAAGTTTAASTAGAAGFGLVDAQRTTHQLNPLQGIDGLGLKLGIRHLHEGKATLATGVPLEGKGAVRHFSKGGEKLEDVFLLSAEGKIADKNTH